jgi:hypothetical protein
MIWGFFTYAQGFQDHTGVVVENTAKKLLLDMHYEAHIQAVIKYHALDQSRKTMKKNVACTLDQELDQYSSVSNIIAYYYLDD